MKITTTDSKVTIEATEAEWRALFRFSSEADMLKSHASVCQMLAEQWELPVCEHCGASCPQPFSCGDCHGGGDPGYDREPATFVDPDTGRRHKW